MATSARRQSLCGVVGATAAVALLATVTAPSDARGADQVRVRANASGSTLAVTVKTLPRSRCSLRLGTSADAVTLPELRVRPGGRGRIRAQLSTSAPTGDQPVVARCGHAGEIRVGKTSVSISAISLYGPVPTAYNIVLDVLLASALAVFALLLGEMVAGATSTRERFLRSAALGGGTILALGAQGVGVDYASWMVDSLVGTEAAGTAVKMLLALLVGLVGGALSWYSTQVILRRDALGMRLACILGATATVGLVVILAEAIHVQGLFLGAAGIPNVAFMVGLIAGLIFLVPAADPIAEDRGGVLTDLIRRLAESRTDPDGSSPRSSERRSPFSGD